MKIGVEAAVLLRKQRTGVDNYSYNLIKEVVKLMPRDTFYLTYISFFSKPPADLGIYGKNVKPRKLQIFPGRVYHLLLRYFVGLPYDVISMLRPDIFFFPNFVRWPLAWTKRSVIVVYDLSFLHAGKYSVKRHRNYLTRVVPISVRKADHVIAISENTKREIIAEYGTAPEKISIVYPAVDHVMYQPAEASAMKAVREKYGLNKPYILSVGTQEPRKNLVGLLKAFEGLDEGLKKKYSLVLTGGKGWLDEEINALYERLSKKYDVIRTGYVDEADLPALYSGSSVFAYPAFYEGFGMPPLEAMACGAPVVVGDNSSLPEVVGDAGMLVDAHSTKAISEALTQVLVNDKLAATMSKNGLVQAKKFVWSAEAAKLAEVFKLVERSK